MKTQNAASHTPTPWKTTQTTVDNQIAIRDGLNRIIALTVEWDDMDTRLGAPGVVGEANAAFIVKAVNMHEALTALARDVISQFGGHAISPIERKWLKMAQDATATGGK